MTADVHHSILHGVRSDRMASVWLQPPSPFEFQNPDEWPSLVGPDPFGIAQVPKKFGYGLMLGFTMFTNVEVQK